MKKLSYKMGRELEQDILLKESQKSIQFSMIVLLLLGLTSCQKAWHGRDGRSGDAYLSLAWQVAEPQYLDAGTGAIPAVFYWGEFYRIHPGVYSLYYEGRIWNGMYWAGYSWEVTYEIWEIQGERGDWYYHGEDGPDNFFTIECNPYGPFISNGYKSTEVNSYKIEEQTDQRIVITKEMNGLGIKVAYQKKSVNVPLEIDQEKNL